MTKKLEERRIELYELEKIKEKRNRVFKVTYVDHTGTRRLEKIFQTKRYVKDYIDNPRFTKIKLYVGDVVDEVE